MPVRALRTVSTGRNGVGGYILPITRLTFLYNDWAGSSKGMNSFLRHTLSPFAAKHPSIEISISPIHGPQSHPLVRADYINGRSKAVTVRNLEPAQILKKVIILAQNSGERNRRIRGKNVVSGNEEGVRGVWSGLHLGAGESTKKV